MPTFTVPAVSVDMINQKDYQDFARKPPPKSALSSQNSRQTVDSISINNNNNNVNRAGIKKRPASAKVTFARSQSDQCLYRPKKLKRKPTPPKDDYDYEGLTNQMRRISFGRSRKWRQSFPGVSEEGPETSAEGRRKGNTKDAKTKEAEEADGEEDEESKIEVSAQAMRRQRSSHYPKYRYPQTFHAGLKSESERFERTIPQCLRLNPRYCFLPVRQNCGYLPLGSVTHLKVHSIKSGCLPHPEFPGQLTPRRSRKRRPMSAPPSVAPTSNISKSLPSGFKPAASSSFFKSRSSFSAQPPARARPLPPRSSQEELRGEPDDLSLGEVEEGSRNGSYQFVYNRENSIEVPVHHDDDDDDNDRRHHNQDDDVLVEDFEAEEDASLEDGPWHLERRDSYLQTPPLSPPPRGPTRLQQRDSSPESIHTDVEEANEDERKKIVRQILTSNEKQRRRRSSKKKSNLDSDEESLDDAVKLQKDLNKQNNRLQTVSTDEDIGYEPDFGDIDSDRESIRSRSIF